LPALAARAGLIGAHLLQTQTPTGQAATAEQKIRGEDAVADWILLAGGYDSRAVAALLDDELQEQTLARHGACHERIAGIYRLSFSLTNKDLPSTSARCDSQPPSIGKFVSQSATRRLPKAADGKKGVRGSRTMQEPLSRAQLRVLGLLNRGLTNQEIAKELEIGVGTIRWHLNNIFGKLQVRNRTEAIVRARELSLV
jgi:ATP/maltotriose-dependent transcriptional regulator MalT